MPVMQFLQFALIFWLTYGKLKNVTEGKFTVAVGDASSSYRDIPAGLPQGSVLSPLLYCIFISDFESPNYCKMSYYADDTGMRDGKLPVI